MEFYLLPLLAFLSLVVVESHASLRSELLWPLVLPNTPKPKFCGFSSGLLTQTASDADLPSEIYWNSVLPNTPMPQAVKNSLRPDLLEDESTPVEIGKGTSMGFSKGGEAMNTYAGAKPAKSLFHYKYAATQDQLHANPNVAVFFLEKDMHPGVKMTLHFTKTTDAVFLPHQLANSLPFSSDKLPPLLHRCMLGSKFWGRASVPSSGAVHILSSQGRELTFARPTPSITRELTFARPTPSPETKNTSFFTVPPSPSHFKIS